MVSNHESCCISSSDYEESDSKPHRAILTPDDLRRFQESSANAEFMEFIEELSEAARDRTLRHPVVQSDAVKEVIDLLDILDGWIVEIPAVATASRFGNNAFQQWYDRLEDRVEGLLLPIMADNQSEVLEVATYLLNSFGNRKRIDYGTGHEAHFIAFLLCLQKLGVVTHQDHPALVLTVFWRYIQLMRSLQMQYWLEPAGSHGVWGLDDYHFLPFLFGASQLCGHKHLRPKAIHNAEIVDEFAKDYMYFACVQFVNSVKTNSLQWHSPMLNDISGVKTWQKVNEGMFKMYKAEVLGKLPIMQHFLFGSLIHFEGSQETADGYEHVHAFGQQHPDCCGIRIPSAIAASATRNKPIPFD